jgi:epidermal growth factor receptor kinase substrate 8
MGGHGHAPPTYLLEHLATFSVSPENDLVYPADGMRRLLAMEKTNGIWTQKMQMRIDRGKIVNIMDHENKDIVEQFPLSLVREPTAFTSNDPKEMYNNILIYIVGHPPGESPMPSEMHIFQCVNVRAREVVEDLKNGSRSRGGGDSSRNHGGGHAQPDIEVGDLHQQPYDSVGEPARMHAQLSAQLEEGVPAVSAVARGSRQSNFDETSSTSSDKYERDVTVLNRCFDDIEKFIARLQHAAAAFRELEMRRRSRKSKKKDHGDGMLSMRAKPPPEREFVDIFQKFKLSFNLLTKLKAHIHDPNAPELVHFLFTPLALIVDASHDSHYGPNLPSKVVSPLLASSAIELLVNCLTSKESELWHSLGEAWYIPAEEWKGYVSPYKPVFMDGWSPSYVDDGGGDVAQSVGQPDGEDEFDGGHGGPQYESDGRGGQVRGGGGGRDYVDRRNSDVSADSSHNNGNHHHHQQQQQQQQHPQQHQQQHHPAETRFEAQQRAFLHDLIDRGCNVVQVSVAADASVI